MKIIYLHQYFNTPSMPFGTRSYEMAKRMVQAGHDVHMITSLRGNEHKTGKWLETEEAGIKVHWYPVPYSNHMGFWSRVMAFIKFAVAAKKKAFELSGDIVFATSTPLTIAIPAVTAARDKKVPMVFEVRDLWPEMPIAVGALKNPILKFLAHKLEHWAYKNSDAIVALSPGMKEGVLKTGYPERKIAVIPNSSDNKEFKYDPDAALKFRSDREWLADAPLLVYGGSFGPTNGVSFLVDVAQELKALNSKVKVLLVGDGADREKVIKKAEEVGVLGDNLYVEPLLPKKDVPALLSAATIASVLFIDLPEMRANSANKFFDALASGTPVFINYGGWMNELVEKYNIGMSGWRKSPKEIASDIESKVNDSAWLEAAGKNARKMAKESFSRDKLAGQLIDVLEAVENQRSEDVSKITLGEAH